MSVTETANTTKDVTVFEWLVQTVVAGLLAGTTYGAMDFVYHARGQTPEDALVAMCLGAVVATPLLLVVALGMAAAERCTATKLGRARWCGWLAGVMVVGLSASSVLCMTSSYRNGYGLLIVLTSVPFAVATHGLASRSSALARRQVSSVAGLIILQAIVLAVCGAASVAARGLHAAFNILVLLIVGGGVIFAVVGIRRSLRRTGLTVLVLLPVSIACFATLGSPHTDAQNLTTETGANRRPNFVLIVLDTTRRDHLGCYGHPGGLTPALDELAVESVVYEHAISPSPWTVPSHASMFTGLFPVTHGCSSEHHLWLDEEFLTLAEVLKAEGYRTIALNSNVAMAQNNLFQGFEDVHQLSGPCDQLSLQYLARIGGLPERWVDKGGWEASRALSRWLTESYDPQHPFFLFINLYEAHDPYVPAYADRKQHLSGHTGYLEATRTAMTARPVLMNMERQANAETKATIGGLYRALVNYQDRSVGDLLGQLRRSVDMDNTLLIVTADHGENLGEAARWGHLQAVNNTLIHVPLIVRYPGGRRGRERVPGLCQLTDIMPTVLDVLEIEHQAAGMSSRTLRPEKFTAAHQAYAQVSPFYALVGTAEQRLGFQAPAARFKDHFRVIRSSTTTFVWSSSGRHRLYDLQTDPFETIDLSAKLPELAQQLNHELLAWWARQPQYVPKEDGPATADPLDQRTIDQLRTLGYMGD